MTNEEGYLYEIEITDLEEKLSKFKYRRLIAILIYFIGLLATPRVSDGLIVLTPVMVIVMAISFYDESKKKDKLNYYKNIRNNELKKQENRMIY
ncbi:MAG: hypothetical protein ACVCEJ_04345 [Candidatus Izemoplasmataceae bacterium]